MVGLRWAFYLDLMLLFGVPWFAWLSGVQPSRSLRAFAMSCAGFGVGLSIAQMVATAKAMSGVDAIAAIPADTYGAIVAGTAMGWAFVCRMVVLILAFAGALALRMKAQWFGASLAATGAIALATLAWNGHGAMDDGGIGYVHLTVDIAHLWAAGAWLGALVVFATAAVMARTDNRTALLSLARATHGFARAGTVIVVTLCLTGVVNYGLVVGMTWRPLITTLYGNLLLAKLSLFVLMLALASLNRYLFGPRLRAAMEGHDVSKALHHLRASFCVEAGLAIAVIGLVAWLGTLAPDGG